MKKSILIFTVLSLFGSLSCKKKSDAVTPEECNTTLAAEYTGRSCTKWDRSPADPGNR